MSEDYTKVLEQNTILEEIIKLMLGGKDESEDSSENNFGLDSNDNFEDSAEGNPEDNNSAENGTDNDEYRKKLYQALVNKHLVIPVQAFEDDGNESVETLTVEPITQASPSGKGEVIIAFTSIQNFQSRMGGGTYIICDTEAIFKLVLQGGFKALIINPGMHWVGILAEDIRLFFNLDNE